MFVNEGEKKCLMDVRKFENLKDIFSEKMKSINFNIFYKYNYYVFYCRNFRALIIYKI